MTLNIRHQIETRFERFPSAAWLLYGDPKIGKTTAASKWGQRVLVINLKAEDNVAHIIGDIVDVTTPQDLAAVCRELRAGAEYDAAVLDGISSLAGVEKGKHSVDDRGRTITDERRKVQEFWREWQGGLWDYLTLPMGRVIVGHSRQEMIDDRGEQVLITLDAPPVLRSVLLRKCQAVGYCWPSDQGTMVNWQTVVERSGRKSRTLQAGNALGLPQTTKLGIASVWAAMPKTDRKPAPVVDQQTGEVVSDAANPTD